MITDDQVWNDNKLTHGDCLRICVTIGMALGEKHSREDDARGLAFTVGGGHLRNGDMPELWIAAMNGWPAEDIAIECCRRKAVKRVGRWGWERNYAS